MAKTGKSRGSKAPSLKAELAESGETPKNPFAQALGDDQADRKFLGREFLTWLIFHADDENGGGHFPRGQEEDAFRVQLGERILLKALGEGQGEIAAKGAAPAQTADVRYSIAGGLTVREADLIFTRGERIWQAAAGAEFFDLKRVKLPALLSEDDAERADERLGLLDELDAMLKAAFRAFLRERLQPLWDTEQVPRIREWLARSILEKKQLEVEIASQEEEEERLKKDLGRTWKRSDHKELN